MSFGLERVTIAGYIDTAVLIFPDEAVAFTEDGIVVKQTDKDESTGNTTGVYFHIRKRKPEDPAGAVIVDI